MALERTTPTTAGLSADRIRLARLPFDWRVVPSGSDALYELQYREPAMLTWQTMYEAPSVRLCLDAYDTLQEGETPACWEDLVL